MRVLIVIGLLVAAALLMVRVLVDLVRDLSRLSYQAPPDLDSSDDWDVEVDEFVDAIPLIASCKEQSPARDAFQVLKRVPLSTQIKSSRSGRGSSPWSTL